MKSFKFILKVSRCHDDGKHDHPALPSNPHRKEGKPTNMKYLAIIAIAAAAFSLGACASKPAPSSSMSSTSSHGYSK